MEEQTSIEAENSHSVNVPVISRYSVSLVYERPSDSLLRSLITKAYSHEEALGKAIVYFEKEAKGYNLKMKCTIQIAEE